MQQLKGISSGQNNKSCSIIHNGSNKIGLEFFWIFCDFLRNLQDPAKLCNYWCYLFANKALERVECLQYGPYGGRPARARQFRRGRRGSWPGKGRRRVRGSPRIGLGAWTGWRCCRRAAHRWPAVAASAAAYWPARVARWNGRARRQAPTRAREGVGWFNWGKTPVGRSTRRGGRFWRRRPCGWPRGSTGRRLK
jgi:hypothetical protein